MRSLFLKIFLWFWAAIVLVVVVSFVAAGLFRQDVPEAEVRAGLAPGMSLFGDVAVERYEEGGAEAVRALFGRLGEGAGLTAYVLDSELQEVTGNAVPEAVEDLARRSLETQDLEFEASDETMTSARPVLGRDGDQYVVVQVRDRSRAGRYGPRSIGQGAGAGRSRAPRADVGESERGWRRDTERFPQSSGSAVPPMAPGGMARWTDFFDPRAATARWTAALLTAILVCFGLARYIASPVRRLRDAASSFAEGDLSARAGAAVTRRGDEIGQLGREFDRMAGRIETLVTHQRALFRDISHELRTPLARLSVALGLARRSASGETAASLDRIEQEAERLNQMIGQTLALARLEGGGEQIERGSVDLRALLEEVVADAEFEAQGRGRSVTLGDGVAVVLDGDERVLRSAFENVIRNGIRYTADGSSVDIDLRTRDTEATVTVCDHGPGVPEYALGDLFRAFYRVTDARERQSGGTGLGLAIAQRAVQLHGGAIAARNDPDGGLVVEIVLPTG